MRIPSYVGNDTWLQVGGERITEHEGRSESSPETNEFLRSVGLEPPQAPGVMYALITFKPSERTGLVDFGYADPKEAMETLRMRGQPDYQIVTVG